jgi:hypothetical protein
MHKKTPLNTGLFLYRKKTTGKGYRQRYRGEVFRVAAKPYSARLSAVY